MANNLFGGQLSIFVQMLHFCNSGGKRCHSDPAPKASDEWCGPGCLPPFSVGARSSGVFHSLHLEAPWFGASIVLEGRGVHRGRSALNAEAEALTGARAAFSG